MTCSCGQHHPAAAWRASSGSDFRFASDEKRAFVPAMRSAILLFAVCIAFFSAPIRAADPKPTAASGEFIILTGGVSLWVWEKWKANPHDNWWMNFVRASRIRIQEIQSE